MNQTLNKILRKWRFLCFLALGLIFSICIACTNLDSRKTTTENTPPPVVSPDKAQEEEVLPPQTVAILESAGKKDLYNPPRGDVRLTVISDLNAAYGSTDYDPEVDKGINLLPFWKPDMLVCSGDMVAGQKPTLTPKQIRAMWNAFDQHVGAPLREAKLPYGFTVGNHDASSAVGIGNKFLFKQERDLASEYWNKTEHNPGVEFIDRNEFPFYYTFKHKDIFFMAWDGSSSKIPPEKLAWVEKALASPEAQNAKMRVLLGHLPLYAVAVGRNKPSEVMENADQLRAMLEKYKVHTYISGHHHAYYPARKGKLQLLHMGILGSGPRPLIDSKLPPTKAITVIDINFDDSKLTTYTTYDIKTLNLIKYEQLPRFLTGHNGMVVRRDLEWKDLTEEEKATCHTKLGEKLCLES
ncbi:MAG: metallophosphoesterase [Cyanobacteria bacterium P01_A01_bin.45]